MSGNHDGWTWNENGSATRASRSNGNGSGTRARAWGNESGCESGTWTLTWTRHAICYERKENIKYMLKEYIKLSLTWNASGSESET